ncbi:MAG: hypothetical protein HZB33_06555 [Nitrospirae bacterium]|nr:hypothetical protein [Nitrospirota bacterium]
MRRRRWHGPLAVSLLLLSSAMYFAQLIIFRKPEDTFFYMLQDIAFVPIQVLIVSLIVERILNEREKAALLKKMNMLIGTFYSEVGSDLIKHCSRFSPDLSELARHLLVTGHWTDRDFEKARALAASTNPHLDSTRDDLTKVREFLESKRGFLLSLLANPNLLEHDAFTDLLWAVFHLLEELTSRTTLTDLPRADFEHLSVDMKRAFLLLLTEWLSYMKHLKKDYPYLFSLAVRMNPMDIHASAVIKD